MLFASNKHLLNLMKWHSMNWLAVLLCMLAIYILSAQPAVTSNSTSKGIVEYGVETTIKLTKAEITEPEKWQIINDINSMGREYMHGVVFLVFGLLMKNAVTQSGGKGIRAIVISLVICIVYAISDEIHQIFVPGRALQLSDLAMDSIGSIIGITVMRFVEYILNFRRIYSK